MMKRLIAIGLAAAALLGANGHSLASDLARGPIVALPDGKVEGIATNGVQSFLGIPFARPPIGSLRWRPPEAIARWTEVKPATRTHIGCVAPESGDGPASNEEDCLYLNVYRPEGIKPGERLPVMLFLHGGGNVWGAPAIYDGERMALAARAVVVIPAYRLGAFGFLSLPAGVEGDTALQDQLAALRWVHSNATALGGSPTRVTLAGESAGAADVCALLAAPSAKGLFSAAIMQSGFCTNTPNRQEAEAIGRAVAAKAGCADASLPCLQALPADRIMAAWGAVWGGGATPLFPMTPSGSAALPMAPMDAFRAGSQAKVPVLVGFDRDELRSFLWQDFPLAKDRFDAIVLRAYRGDAKAVASEYPLTNGEDPLYTLGAIRSDQMIICPSLTVAGALSHHVPVSTFEFADRTAPPFRGLAARHPVPEGFNAGASHTSELRYLFGYQAVARDLSPNQARLADDMTRLWVAFGRTSSASRWAPFTAALRRTTVFALPAAGGIDVQADVYNRHHCAFWVTHPIAVTSLLP